MENTRQKHVTFDTKPNIRYVRQESSVHGKNRYQNNLQNRSPYNSQNLSYANQKYHSQNPSQYGLSGGDVYTQSTLFGEIKRKLYENKYIIISAMIISSISVLIIKYFMDDQFLSKRVFISFFSYIIAFIVTDLTLRRYWKI